MVSREPEYQGDGGSNVACDAVISHLTLLEGNRWSRTPGSTSSTCQRVRQVVTLRDDKVSEVRNYLWDPQALPDAMVPDVVPT